jgi:hypothetical protein
VNEAQSKEGNSGGEQKVLRQNQPTSVGIHPIFMVAMEKGSKL